MNQKYASATKEREARQFHRLEIWTLSWLIYPFSSWILRRLR